MSLSGVVLDRLADVGHTSRADAERAPLQAMSLASDRIGRMVDKRGMQPHHPGRRIDDKQCDDFAEHVGAECLDVGQSCLVQDWATWCVHGLVVRRKRRAARLSPFSPDNHAKADHHRRTLCAHCAPAVRFRPITSPSSLRRLRGGDDVTGGTLSRFHSVHAAVLPALTTALIAMYLLLVQRQGMSVPPSIERRRRPGERLQQMPFFPNHRDPLQ